MDNFQILNYIEKTLKRPSRVIGDIDTTNHVKFIIKDGKIKEDDILFNPGLNKIIREIIDNSTDEYVRTDGKYSNNIHVNIDDNNYEIEVKDNGRGIPISLIKDLDNSDILIPVAAWTKIDAGSNFDDDIDSITNGQNGEGAALTNIFSIHFRGETTNIDGKNLILDCKNNLSEQNVKIKEKTNKSNGTTVSFIPDYKRFGCNNLPIGNIEALMFDLLHIGMNYSSVNFYFNKQKINAKNTKEYANMLGDNFEFIEDKGIKIVLLPNETDNFKFIHFINGLNVFNGGAPLNWIVDNIVDRLHTKLLKKYSSIKKGDIKNKIFISVLFDGMINPRFEDQIKSKCKNKYSDFKSQIGDIDFDKFADKIYKNKAIIDPITEMYRIKEEFKKRQELKGLEKTVKKIKSDKYLPAIEHKKYLMICEGASAVGGLAPVLGRKECGFFEIRGKPLNSYSAEQSKFMSNKELSELYRVIQNENYEKIVFANDADLDGTHIAGLLIGFFERYMPELKGKIGRLKTPVKILKKNKKLLKWVYNLNDELSPKNGEDFSYLKGIGGWDSDDLKHIISTDGIHNMVEIFEWNDVEIIEEWLGNNSEPRKKYILDNDFSIARI